MRYQELIYIQNAHNGVRNKDILNVNMSSDMCVFAQPLYNLSGASHFDCSGSTGTSYVFNTSASTIDLVFDFTANTNSFTATNATFKYEVYKYDNKLSAFTAPAIYSSNSIEYSAISGTSSVAQNIPLSGLSLDGEYIIKGYYVFDACTDFLRKLGKKIDTLEYRSGKQYGLYDEEQDYYFMAMYAADKPIFLPSSSNTPPANKLFQQVILPEPETTVIAISNSVSGNFILTLNGLVLAPSLDYTYSGNIVTLSSNTVFDDIITVIYNTSGGNNLSAENINITKPVFSGTTGNQGENKAFYNTSTGKYEIYTLVTPEPLGSIIVMINGVTLASGVDYYQSISDPKRIILEGDILLDDIITIVYYPLTNVVNGLNTNVPLIGWNILNAPQKNNGQFDLEVSTASTFNILYTSVTVNYIANQHVYSASFMVSGKIGEQFYYRVKNTKNYVTICGQSVSSVTYSDIIPIKVQTNAINSY